MSEPSSILRIELQGIGENLNTWGFPRLNEALRRLEEAAHGVTTIALSAAGERVLTSVNYAADEARAPILVLTGDPGGAVEIITPSVSHWWLVDNRTTGNRSITLKTAAGGGYALRPGPQLAFCDGTSVLRGTPRLDQLPLAENAVDANGQRFTNLAAPLNPADAARKADVDAVTDAVAADADRAEEKANLAADDADRAEEKANLAADDADRSRDEADRSQAAALAAEVALGQLRGVAIKLASGATTWVPTTSDGAGLSVKLADGSVVIVPLT